MTSLRALGLLLRGGVHLLRGWRLLRWGFPRMSPAQRQAAVQQWAQTLLRIWRIRLHVQGLPPAHGPLLLVANHTSWLDIVALHAAGYCRFVSKAEVRRWPFIGLMAERAGTLFLQRQSRRDAHRTADSMTQALMAGDVLAVFPEGATGDGRQLLPFHGNLIQAAIAAPAPVLPVALRFVDSASGQPSPAPGYAGSQSLLQSVWRTLRHPGLTAVVHYGQPQRAQGRERRAWAQDLRQSVADMLQD